MNQSNPLELIAALQGALPADSLLLQPKELAHYGSDWLKEYPAKPCAIALPTSIADVQNVVRICNERNAALVPSGGRTGLSGGATAHDGQVVLSLERLHKIYEVDQASRTVRCQAGAITEKVQLAAANANLLFPIDFASKGSSQIGGNIATNAGGIRVIRYGNIREWVLGLTIVTAHGELLELNGALVKNQTGYDLRSLLIGSEGTLGIIVEAILKLTTRPLPNNRILCAHPESTSMMTLLKNARARFGTIGVFEFIARPAMEEILAHSGIREPFAQPSPFYTLLEIDQINASSSDLESFFAEQIEEQVVTDVVIAANSKQAKEFMDLRERIGEALAARHTLHKNDISVPVSEIPAFLEALTALVSTEYHGASVALFGHIGDGNIHVNILNSSKRPDQDFFAQCKRSDEKIFALVQKHSGSISAEHGVGLLKRAFLHYSRSPIEIELMRQIKRAFDPKGILNPGKIFE